MTDTSTTDMTTDTDTDDDSIDETHRLAAAEPQADRDLTLAQPATVPSNATRDDTGQAVFPGQVAGDE